MSSSTARLVLAATLLAGAALPAVAARLVDSWPARGEALAAAPAEIRLTFDQRVEPRAARVKLVGAKGKLIDADRPHADRADANSVLAAVPVLHAGHYQVLWYATGADGKRSRGTFTFTIGLPAATAASSTPAH